MRSIIRFSVDGEADSRLRNTLAGYLENEGFQRTGTGTFENKDISQSILAAVMQRFWAVVQDPQKKAGAAEGVVIDHVWTYSDDPSYEP